MLKIKSNFVYLMSCVRVTLWEYYAVDESTVLVVDFTDRSVPDNSNNFVWTYYGKAVFTLFL